MPPVPPILHSIWRINKFKHLKKKKKKIQGLTIPNKKEIKLLQFADDINFITNNEESIIEIKNFLARFEKASRPTININKTTITPLANANIYNLENKI